MKFEDLEINHQFKFPNSPDIFVKLSPISLLETRFKIIGTINDLRALDYDVIDLGLRSSEIRNKFIN